MKRLMIMCGFISIMNIACAQQIKQRSPEQRAEHRTLVLEKQLKLSPEQAKKAKSILLAQAVCMDSLRRSRQAAKKNRRLTRKEIFAQTDTKLNSLFTADQKTAYVKWKELKKSKHRKRKADTIG